jgi:hypothetical protein
MLSIPLGTLRWKRPQTESTYVAQKCSHTLLSLMFAGRGVGVRGEQVRGTGVRRGPRGVPRGPKTTSAAPDGPPGPQPSTLRRNDATQQQTAKSKAEQPVPGKICHKILTKINRFSLQSLFCAHSSKPKLSWGQKKPSWLFFRTFLLKLVAIEK